MITTIQDQNAFRKQSFDSLETVYTRLNNFIQKINQKILSRIQLVQQVYLDDYKAQVSVMAAQLRSIRGVLDEQILKQRSNERLFYLEEERDFFRAQVIKLNEDLKVLTQNNQKMKAKLYEAEQETSSYKKLVYELETKIYKLTYQNIEIQKLKQQGKKTAETPSMITPRKQFESERNRKYQYKSHRSKPKDENHDTQSNPSEMRMIKSKTQYSLRKLKPSQSMTASQQKISKQPSSREQILDSCIKQLKKQIYYRNLNLKESNKIHFEQEQSINFSKFTKSDKKQLIYKFMSNPEILEDLYKLVFLKQRKSKIQREQDNILSKIALAKGIDPKFNTKMLNGFKADFDRRIFGIKANRY